MNHNKRKKWLKQSCSVMLILCMVMGLVLPHTSIRSLASNIEQKTPEELGFERVSLEDFGIPDGTYQRAESGAVQEVYRTYSGDSLDGKYLDVDVAFGANQGAGTSIRYGNADGWQGIQIYATSDGKFGVWATPGNDYVEYTAQEIGIESVTDTFNVKLGVDFGEGYKGAESANCSATICLWINNKLIVKDMKFGSVYASGKNMSIVTDAGKITVSTPKHEQDKQCTPESLGFKRVTLEDFGIEDGTYQKEDSGAAHAAYGTYNGDSLDKTYLDVDVSFGANQGAGTSIRYGNADGWQGIQIYATSDGKFGVWATPGNDYVEYTAQEIGIESVTDTFNVKLGVDFGEGYKGTESANCSATLCLWINNKLIVQDMQFSSVSATGNQMSIVTDAGKITVSTPNYTPEDLDFERVVLADFGAPEQKWETNATGDAYSWFYYTKGDSLDMKYLDVDLSFEMIEGQDYGTSLRYANGDGWGGIQIGATAEGKLRVGDANGDKITYEWEDIGITTVTEPFNLKLAIDFGEGYKGTENANCNASYWLWINDVLVDQVDLSPMISTGYKITFYRPNGNFTATTPVEQTPPDEPLPPVEQATPEELGFERVVLADFGTPEQKWETNATGDAYSWFYYTKGDSLDMKYLDVNLSFDMIEGQEYGTSLRYANGDGWGGIQIGATAEGKLRVGDANGEKTTYELKDIGIETVTEPFNLKLAIDFGDGYKGTENADCNASYWLWINDVLVDQVNLSPMISTGHKITFYRPNGNFTATTPVEQTPPDEPLPPVEQATPEELGYSKKVTPIDFNISDGRYETNADGSEARSYDSYQGESGSLDMTYLDIDISFDMIEGQDYGTSLRYGSADGWRGIQIGGTSQGLQIGDATDSSVTYSLKQLGIETLTEPFNMKLATDFGEGYLGTGEATCDITYCLWINDVLIVKDVKLPDVDATGNILAVYRPNGNIWLATPESYYVKLEQMAPEELGYEKLSLIDFGIDDMTYESNETGDAYNWYEFEGQDRKLDMKYLDVDISFGMLEGQSYATSLRYGNGDGWGGIQIGGTSEGLRIGDANGSSRVYTLKQLGIESLTKTFNMKLATDFGDGYVGTESATCDVTYCLWINDVFIAKDVKLSSMRATGNRLAIYRPNGSITLGTPKTYIPDQVFTELTATDFGLDGRKVSNGTYVGKYSDEHLVATAVTMMLNISRTKGNSICIGGADVGIKFTSKGDGTIAVSYVESKNDMTELLVMNADKAGVSSLTGNNLKWRFTFRLEEFVNSNRVTVGIYVNGKLYNSKRLILKNVDTDCFKHVIGLKSQKGEIDIKDFKYQELTVSDFNMKNRVLSSTTEYPYTNYNFCDNDTLDGNAVTAIVRYGEGTENRFALGALNNGWDGMNFISTKDGRISVVYVDKKGTAKTVTQLTAEKAGLETLVGQELKIRVTFDFMKNGKSKTDLRLGIYLNDEFYGNFAVENVDIESFYRTIRLYVTAAPFSIKSVEKKHSLSMYGFDAEWKKTLGIKN